MKWQERISDNDLASGNLHIIGDHTKTTDRDLTPKNLEELVAAATVQKITIKLHTR